MSHLKLVAKSNDQSIPSSVDEDGPQKIVISSNQPHSEYVVEIENMNRSDVIVFLSDILNGVISKSLDFWDSLE